MAMLGALPAGQHDRSTTASGTNQAFPFPGACQNSDDSYITNDDPSDPIFVHFFRAATASDCEVKPGEVKSVPVGVTEANVIAPSGSPAFRLHVIHI